MARTASAASTGAPPRSSIRAKGRYVIPIPGTKTPKYLLENIDAADVELSAADLAELDTLPPPEGARY